jgi:hypothetical protein
VTSDLAPPKEVHPGLSSREAAVRLTRDGGNTLPQRQPTPLWRRIVTQLPGLALGSEPGDPDAMHRPPRPPTGRP